MGLTVGFDPADCGEVVVMIEGRSSVVSRTNPVGAGKAAAHRDERQTPSRSKLGIDSPWTIPPVRGPGSSELASLRFASLHLRSERSDASPPGRASVENGTNTETPCAKDGH